MVTGVTRPFHAPHALFTPSMSSTRFGFTSSRTQSDSLVHETFLRS